MKRPQKGKPAAPKRVINVWMTREFLAEVDQYRFRSQTASRQKAIRQLIRSGLSNWYELNRVTSDADRTEG